MKITSRILSFAGLLLLTLEVIGQDTINPRTMFPSGIFLGYGQGFYSVKDEYISKEKYSGTLPYLSLEWRRFHNNSAYRLEFETQRSTNISNHSITAKVVQLVFNQDFSYTVGSFPLLSRSVYAYLGPSAQFFFYDIDYNFAQPGTFISPNTFGIIGSLGINCALIYPVNNKLLIEGFIRSNVISFSGKKIDEYRFIDVSSPALLYVYTATKIDSDISLRYYLSKRVSASLGYKFDLSRIDKWDSYVATSSSLLISVNLKF